MPRVLQSLTVAWCAYPYDGSSLRHVRWSYIMRYPYDILTATCLFIIVVSTSIMLALC